MTRPGTRLPAGDQAPGWPAGQGRLEAGGDRPRGPGRPAASTAARQGAGAAALTGQEADTDDALDGVGHEHLAGVQQLFPGHRRLRGADAGTRGEPQHRGPGDPGQQPAVRGWRAQEAADHREHVGPVGLQDLAVAVGDQQMRVRAGRRGRPPRPGWRAGGGPPTCARRGRRGGRPGAGPRSRAGRQPGITSIVTCSGPPTGRAVSRSRPDGPLERQVPRSACRPGGRCLPNSARALASSRARCLPRSWPRPAVTRSEVNTPVAGRGSSPGGTATVPAAPGRRAGRGRFLEERRVQRPDQRAGFHQALAVLIAGGRDRRRSRRRCPATPGRRRTRTCGSRRSAPARPPGCGSRRPRCTPPAASPRARG